MYTSTLRFLEKFTLQFSTLLKREVYDVKEILALESETERREREFSERVRFSPSSALSYITFLLEEEQEISTDFEVKRPGEELPLELVYSRRRAIEICRRFIEEADIESCMELIRLLNQTQQLESINSTFFDSGIARFPNNALFYCLKASNVKDTALSRRMFELNYHCMNCYEETHTLFGNWLQLEMRYIADMLPEGVTVAEIEDEKLRSIAQGELVVEVLKLAIVELAGHAVVISIPEAQRMRVIQQFGRDEAWKLAAFKAPEEVLMIARLGRSLQAYEEVVGEDFRYYLRRAVELIEPEEQDVRERLDAEGICIEDPEYEHGVTYDLGISSEASQSEGTFGED